jgi:hypothetical protein
MRTTEAAAPRVTVVLPDDVPALMSAMATRNKRAEQLLPPVLKLAARVRAKKGSTCPCCGGRLSSPFATVLIYKARNTEPSLAAAICVDAPPPQRRRPRRMWGGG